MQTFWLILKWLPELIVFAKKLEELGHEAVVSARIKRSKDKIEIAFNQENPVDAARILNDAFKS